jgi:hypothetical protein
VQLAHRLAAATAGRPLVGGSRGGVVAFGVVALILGILILLLLLLGLLLGLLLLDVLLLLLPSLLLLLLVEVEFGDAVGAVGRRRRTVAELIRALDFVLVVFLLLVLIVLILVVLILVFVVLLLVLDLGLGLALGRLVPAGDVVLGIGHLAALVAPGPGLGVAVFVPERASLRLTLRRALLGVLAVVAFLHVF